ncbi:MAG: hypothetical protein L6R37_005006 [Teloschistes peruensis]|nr:MAG: hypothetical protein L6R37_005006 [Teloschistes peruensis]
MGDHHDHGSFADILDLDHDTPTNASSLPSENSPVPSVNVAQSSAHPRTVKPGLRFNFSRRFGSARTPREARPKALVRPKPASSLPAALEYRGPPRATLYSKARQESLPLPAVLPPTIFAHSKSDPRFVDLRDRLVKIPIAVPTSIQRARPEPSTDQTMATCATSILSDHSSQGGHRVNNGVDAEDGAVKRPSVLAKMKSIARHLFAPIFRWLRKGKEPETIPQDSARRWT